MKVQTAALEQLSSDKAAIPLAIFSFLLVLSPVFVDSVFIGDLFFRPLLYVSLVLSSLGTHSEGLCTLHLPLQCSPVSLEHQWYSIVPSCIPLPSAFACPTVLGEFSFSTNLVLGNLFLFS